MASTHLGERSPGLSLADSVATRSSWYRYRISSSGRSGAIRRQLLEHGIESHRYSVTGLRESHSVPRAKHAVWSSRSACAPSGD